MLRKFLFILAQLWAFVTIPIVFLLVAAPVTTLLIPFPVRYRLMGVGPTWKIFSRWTLHFGCWAKVYARDERAPEFKTYPPKGLYIANHQSFMDIPLVLTQFQVPPIMKKEVLYIPIIGLMAWAGGAMIVSRRKRNSRKKVFIQARRRLVEQGFAVQYYPEGTRNRFSDSPKAYGDIKVTLIHLAFEGNVPVIPVSIYGTRDVLSKRGFINPGKQVGIYCQNALNPADYPDATSFAKAAWAKVQEGHAQLKVQLES